MLLVFLIWKGDGLCSLGIRSWVSCFVLDYWCLYSCFVVVAKQRGSNVSEKEREDVSSLRPCLWKGDMETWFKRFRFTLPELVEFVIRSESGNLIDGSCLICECLAHT